MSADDDARKARLQAALGEVRRDFESRLEGEVAYLQQLIDSADYPAAHQLAHRLAGAGKLFGHPEVTEQARQIEQMLATESEPDPDALRQALHALTRMLT